MIYYEAPSKLFKINTYRVKKISQTLKEVFDDGILDTFIEMDPQYKALKNIYLSLRDQSLTTIIAIANSLISYQLSGRGEDYWREVGEFFSKTRLSNCMHLYKLFTDFLTKYTKYNRLGIQYKLKRLGIFFESKIIDQIQLDPCMYNKDQYTLLETLSKIMRQPKYAKTIVFSVKMYYYVARFICKNTVPDPRIPIPVDRRIAYISFTSGLITIPNKIHLENVKDMIRKAIRSKYRNEIIKAWFLLSEHSGISCMLLDTIVWLIGKYVDPFKSIDEMVEEFTRDYGLILSFNSLWHIFNQFTYVFSPYS